MKFSMKGCDLLPMMEADFKNGLCPAFVVVTLGTTGLCAFDDLESITQVIREFEKDNNLNVWIHVDSAYGGPMFWIPEKRHFMQDSYYVSYY